jgi:hypothetical protein
MLNRIKALKSRVREFRRACPNSKIACDGIVEDGQRRIGTLKTFGSSAHLTAREHDWSKDQAAD